MSGIRAHKFCAGCVHQHGTRLEFLNHRHDQGWGVENPAPLCDLYNPTYEIRETGQGYNRRFHRTLVGCYSRRSKLAINGPAMRALDL